MTKLFGTDGIRGTVGEWPLVPEFFLKLGQAAGKVLKTQPNASVVIGRDTRQSGVMLQSALTAGLLSCGINVIDLGVIPTSAVSWLTPRLNAEAGVVISASHNPVRENGIKFFSRNGQKLSEKLEEAIETLRSFLRSLKKPSKHCCSMCTSSPRPMKIWGAWWMAVLFTRFIPKICSKNTRRVS
jgi:phosphomannomutase